MIYELREAQPGKFEVVQHNPVVLGTFADMQIATKFFDFLVHEESTVTAELELASDETVPEEVATPAQPVVAQTETTAPVFSDEAWTDGELESAFKLLSEGHKLRIVAAQHGKCWKKLRSKWAASKRGGGNISAPQASTALVPVTSAAEPPLQKVTTAISELNDQQVCRICEKHFTATPDNLDLCARCNHGA